MWVATSGSSLFLLHWAHVLLWAAACLLSALAGVIAMRTDTKQRRNGWTSTPSKSGIPKKNQTLTHSIQGNSEAFDKFLESWAAQPHKSGKSNGRYAAS